MVSTRCWAFAVSWCLVSGQDNCETSGDCFKEAQEIGPSLLSKRSFNERFFTFDDVRQVPSCSFVVQGFNTITSELENLRRTPEELKERVTYKANQSVTEIATVYEQARENLNKLKQLFLPSTQGPNETAAENDTDNYLVPAEKNETKELITPGSILGPLILDDDDDAPFLLQTNGKTSISKDEIIKVVTSVIFEQISPFATNFFDYLEKRLDKETEILRKFIQNIGQKILDLIEEVKTVLQYPGVSQQTRDIYGKAFDKYAIKTKNVMDGYETIKKMLADKAKELFAMHFPQQSDVLSLEQKETTEVNPLLAVGLNAACMLTDVQNAVKNGFQTIYTPLSGITQKKNDLISTLEASVDSGRDHYMHYLTKIAGGIALAENAVKNDLLR